MYLASGLTGRVKNKCNKLYILLNILMVLYIYAKAAFIYSLNVVSQLFQYHTEIFRIVYMLG